MKTNPSSGTAHSTAVEPSAYHPPPSASPCANPTACTSACVSQSHVSVAEFVSVKAATVPLPAFGPFPCTICCLSATRAFFQ